MLGAFFARRVLLSGSLGLVPVYISPGRCGLCRRLAFRSFVAAFLLIYLLLIVCMLVFWGGFGQRWESTVPFTLCLAADSVLSGTSPLSLCHCKGACSVSLLAIIFCSFLFSDTVQNSSPAGCCQGVQWRSLEYILLCVLLLFHFLRPLVWVLLTWKNQLSLMFFLESIAAKVVWGCVYSSVVSKYSVSEWLPQVPLY